MANSCLGARSERRFTHLGDSLAAQEVCCKGLPQLGALTPLAVSYQRGTAVLSGKVSQWAKQQDSKQLKKRLRLFPWAFLKTINVSILEFGEAGASKWIGPSQQWRNKLSGLLFLCLICITIIINAYHKNFKLWKNFKKCKNNSISFNT